MDSSTTPHIDGTLLRLQKQSLHGREFLQKTMDNAEKQGFKVLYADTDGFYAKIDQK